ncbi:MAG: hypothetical protein KBD64_05715 [Gammaproteobacteria bacterium]|nr:hypothetical protein [Gammaproteobacteria bacterium]
MANAFSRLRRRLSQYIQTKWNKVSFKKIYAVWIAGPIVGILNYADNRAGLKYGLLLVLASLFLSEMPFLTVLMLTAVVSFATSILFQYEHPSRGFLDNLWFALTKGVIAALSICTFGSSLIVTFLIGHTLGSVIQSITSYFSYYSLKRHIDPEVENPIYRGYNSGTTLVEVLTNIPVRAQGAYVLSKIAGNFKKSFNDSFDPPRFSEDAQYSDIASDMARSKPESP